MSSPSPSDRRRHHRVHIHKLTGSLRSPGDVAVLDLSLAGLSFEALSQVAPGERCFLDLRHGSGSASVEVEIRWTSVRHVDRPHGKARPVFRAGGAFTEIVRENDSGIFDWLVVEPGPEASGASA